MRPLAPSIDSLRALCRRDPGPKVTVFLSVPENPGFDEVAAFEGSLERLAGRVRERFAALGLDERDGEIAAKKLESMDVELASLSSPVRSLAFFVGPDERACFRLGVPFSDRVHVGRSYRIRPLILAEQLEAPFRVLALSTNDVALYEGDLAGLQPVHADGLPRSMEEALGHELTDSQLQLRSSASGGKSAIFHGHGGADAGREVDLDRFHHAVARAVERAWSRGERPVVLVADRAHTGRFRRVARLPGMLPRGVIGNPSAWSREQLHARALDVVRDGRRRRLGEALEASDRAHAEARLSEAAPAAVAGRVARVVVDADSRVVRHIDPDSGALGAAFGDEDALDELCAIVLTHGGDVLVRTVDDTPAGSPGEVFAELRSQARG